MLFAATPDLVAGPAYTLAAATCDEQPMCALTPRERSEYDALPHPARQRDWLAGRLAAKRAIAARWNVPAAEIELVSAPDSAPRPCVRSRAGGLSPLPGHLTIAHRDGVAIAAAFPATTRVGVDLERIAEVSSPELRYFVSERERAGLGATDATVIWLLKEAAWKALGPAPRTPFSSVQLVFQANALVALKHGARELKARAVVRHRIAGRPLLAALVQIAPEAS